MLLINLFGKKKNEESSGVHRTSAIASKSDELATEAKAYINQARSSLLEANVSGVRVREAQEMFKRAVHANGKGEYGKAIELAMECIDLVDDVMKNE